MPFFFSRIYFNANRFNSKERPTTYLGISIECFKAIFEFYSRFHSTKEPRKKLFVWIDHPRGVIGFITYFPQPITNVCTQNLCLFSINKSTRKKKRKTSIYNRKECTVHSLFNWSSYSTSTSFWNWNTYQRSNRTGSDQHVSAGREVVWELESCLKYVLMQRAAFFFFGFLFSLIWTISSHIHWAAHPNTVDTEYISVGLQQERLCQSRSENNFRSQNDSTFIYRENERRWVFSLSVWMLG